MESFKPLDPFYSILLLPIQSGCPALTNKPHSQDILVKLILVEEESTQAGDDVTFHGLGSTPDCCDGEDGKRQSDAAVMDALKVNKQLAACSFCFRGKVHGFFF